MYIKKYLLSNLTSPKSEILGRISLIEKITEGKTTFEFQDEFLIRKSLIIKGTKPHQLKEIHFKKIASKMDYSHQLGVVHGDLHMKNMLVIGDDIEIIDWEPCLNQILGNLNTLMYTAPWIDPEDKLNRELTINTDLMCFYRLKNQQKYNYFKENDWFMLKKNAKDVTIPFTFLNKEPSYEFTSKTRQKRSF